jgi:hypothetical protein
MGKRGEKVWSEMNLRSSWMLFVYKIKRYKFGFIDALRKLSFYVPNIQDFSVYFWVLSLIFGIWIIFVNHGVWKEININLKRNPGHKVLCWWQLHYFLGCQIHREKITVPTIDAVARDDRFSHWHFSAYWWNFI